MSSSSQTPNITPNHNLHSDAAQPLSNPPWTNEPGSTFYIRPPWLPLISTALKWTWVDRAGPFIITGEIREMRQATSETESDSATVTMFNLDSLNSTRPEAM